MQLFNDTLFAKNKLILPHFICNEIYHHFQMEDKLKNLETDMKTLSSVTPLSFPGDIFSSDVDIIQTDDRLSDNAGMPSYHLH